MGGGFKPSIVDPGGLSLLVLWNVIIAGSVNDTRKDWILHYEKARLAGGNACDNIRLATEVVGRIDSIYPLKPSSPCLLVLINVIGS